MFYDKLVFLCEDKGMSPSAVLRSLGYSTANLKKWREGKGVTSTVMEDFSKYFDVPISYFYFDDDNGKPYDPKENGKPFKEIFSILKSHIDYIVSLIFRKTIYEYDIMRIATYMKCPNGIYDLIIDDSIINKNDIRSDVHSPLFLVSEILSSLPGSADYQYLQVQISKIILKNLENREIYAADLKNKVGLVHKKIDKLKDDNIDDYKKKGLNFSDVVNIARKLNVSIELMLTGDGKIDYDRDKEVYIL